MKYVKNTHIANVKCFIRSIRNPGFTGGKPNLDMFVFRPEQIDRMNGTQVETGYTRLEDDEYEALLKESKGFVHAIERENILHVFDELPAEALTPSDVIAQLNQKISDLQTQLDGTKSGAAIKDLQAKVDELQKKSDEYNKVAEAFKGLEQYSKDLEERVAGLNAIIDAIDPVVVEAAKATIAGKAGEETGPQF